MTVALQNTSPQQNLSKAFINNVRIYPRPLKQYQFGSGSKRLREANRRHSKVFLEEMFNCITIEYTFK